MPGLMAAAWALVGQYPPFGGYACGLIAAAYATAWALVGQYPPFGGYAGFDSGGACDGVDVGRAVSTIWGLCRV